MTDVPTALRERAFQYAHQHTPVIRTEANTAAWTLVFYKYIHARILKWPTLDKHKREELYDRLEDMIAAVVAEQVTGDNYDDPTTQDQSGNASGSPTHGP